MREPRQHTQLTLLTTTPAAATSSETPTPLHLDLAVQALVDGWTRAQVIEALIGRIKRDQGYLAYRKACHRRTSYDDQVQQDQRALALAACWLADASGSGERMSVEVGSQRPADRSLRDECGQPDHDARRPGDTPRVQRRVGQSHAHKVHEE